MTEYEIQLMAILEDSKGAQMLENAGIFYGLHYFHNKVLQMLYIEEPETCLDRMAALYSHWPKIATHWEIPIFKFSKKEKGKYAQLRFTHEYALRIPKSIFSAFTFPVRPAFGIGIFLTIFFTFSYFLA